MLNSEHIFSDSRTLNAIEDTFFRRAMAIYCENESKKVMSELEASDTEPKRSAAPVSRIFAKLRRQSGFSNAFRIAKKITDRVALFVLAVVIIFVGAVTASAEVRSSLAEFTSRWGTFTNIAEEPFDLDGEDVKSFKADYSTVWNFDMSGSRNLLNGEKIFGGEIVDASSNYFINYTNGESDLDSAICSANTYTVQYSKDSDYTVKGIICEDELENGYAVFYPYYNEDGNNLFMVCARDETEENNFRETLYLTLPDGTNIKVQPFYISLWTYRNAGDDIVSHPLLTDFSSNNEKYFEAEIKFNYISVSAYSMGEDDAVWGTRASGLVDTISDIKIIKEY